MLPPFDSLVVSPNIALAFGSTAELEVMVGGDGRYSPGLSLGEVPTGSRGNYAVGDVRVQTDVVLADPPADGVTPSWPPSAAGRRGGC